MRAVELAFVEAVERANLTRRGLFNLWGMLPDLNSDGEKGFEAGPGVQLTVPVFHQNQGATARAEAQAERLLRQGATLRDRIALEVRQAHTRLVQAQEDLAVWREQIVPEAMQSVARAQKALEEDRASLLLVLETTRQLLGAQQREAEVAADVRRAVAELERSVGRQLTAETGTRPAEPLAPPEPEVEEPLP